MDLKTLSQLSPWDWPADAGATLLGALRSRAADDADQLLAVELSGSTTVMNDELAGALLEIIRDPAEAERIRGAAAIALGPTLEELGSDAFDEIEDPLVSEGVARAIRDSLRETYLETGAPREVRRRALEASVRGEADWHAGAVRAAYHSGDDEWRLTAVFCMSYVKGFDREIEEALASGDPKLRYEAVHAAGNWAVDAAWPHIRAVLRAGEDVDKPLLLAAVDAAVCIRPAEAAEVLGELAESEDDEIAEAALEALAMAEGLTHTS
jgi:hypothetical protein